MTYLPDVLYYDAPFNLYGISFSASPVHPNRVALTSFQSTSTNKLQVVDAPSSSSSSSQTDFQVLATTNIALPPTKVGFEPQPGSLHGYGSDASGGSDVRKELIATSGDLLRIWEMTEDSLGGGGGDYRMDGMEAEDMRYGRGGYVGNGGWVVDNGLPRCHLTERSKLSNSKSSPANLPPLTSFTWNPHNPKSIVTCSIDTTATVWDISTSSAITQLIAHDREVYDISWLPASSDVFVSVGADGSLRAFDLRSLEHSTILFETDDHRPLARIGFSGAEQHYLSTFGVGDEKAIVLDMRSPGKPVVELSGHGAALGAIGWGGESRAGLGGGGYLATCGDDAQLLIYDLTQPLPYPTAAAENKSRSGHSASKSSANNPSHSSSGSASNDPNSAATSRSSTANSGSNFRTGTRHPCLAWNSGYGEINNLAWGKEHSAGKGSGEKDGCWIGAVSGKRMTCLRF